MWTDRLTAEDKRALTPLLHAHINPYGLFPLDLTQRLGIKVFINGTEDDAGVAVEEYEQKEEELV